ncbi:cytochrome b/b6 domain-containing protein [Rheinheimera pleomorphica]|uniref:cytochrome b/b6 domain-containing protein n=1 Tax=Rheinheimera pleomorphica TaxID=2703963 RepID=UPI00141E6FF2|nr:cytochrome b/b6 domain-containing protein [Rheinheimera pleomorphica]
MATRVYDLPTRILHWLFAGSFITAFTIANTVDDDAVAFSFHMLAGLMLCFSVLLRLLWGIIGSKHARFSDFSLQPAALKVYLSGVFSAQSRLWHGHNPASSWAAVTMFILAIGLGLTGYLMVSAGRDSVKDLHELFANAFIIVVLLHLAGIVLHQLKHKDGLGKSMITGEKPLPEATAPVKVHKLAGISVLVLTLGFASYLLTNFDSQSRTLNLFGSALHLAEADEHKGSQHDDD